MKLYKKKLSNFTAKNKMFRPSFALDEAMWRFVNHEMWFSLVDSFLEVFVKINLASFFIDIIFE